MKLKRLGTLLLTAIIAATTLAGCGAMPSTGNGMKQAKMQVS